MYSTMAVNTAPTSRRAMQVAQKVPRPLGAKRGVHSGQRGAGTGAGTGAQQACRVTVSIECVSKREQVFELGPHTGHAQVGTQHVQVMVEA